MIKRWIGIVLLANGLCAQSVIVTGTWTPVPLEEADRAVRQLPVNNNTLLLSNSWDDLLDPSLDLQQRAPNGVLTDLAIRGGTFGQTLVLLNGLRINDARTGHFNMNLPVPLDDVDRIEVLQGMEHSMPGSAVLLDHECPFTFLISFQRPAAPLPDNSEFRP